MGIYSPVAVLIFLAVCYVAVALTESDVLGLLPG